MKKTRGMRRCRPCKGIGKSDGVRCLWCRGTGQVPREKKTKGGRR